MSKSFMAALLATVALPGMAHAQATPSDFTHTTSYDAMHRVTGTVAPDPDGTGPLRYAAVRNSYDAAGRLVRVESGELSDRPADGLAPAYWNGFTVFRQVDTDYDVMDRKIAERMSSNGSVYAAMQYSYNALGRADCTVMRMNPNADPNAPLPSAVCTRTTAQEAADNPDRITRNVYDAVGHVTEIHKAVDTPIAQTYVAYQYSANGKQLLVTDANGNVAEIAYDGFDREKTWYFPNKTQTGGVDVSDYEAYDYDPDGNRTYWRKRDGHVFTFCYDALNRQSAKLTVATACGAASYAVQPTRNVFYQYDAWGRQTEARFDAANGSDRVENGYDGFGRLTATTTAMAGTSRSLAFHFDADGDRDTITHQDGNAWVYAYDGLDRLNGITQGGAQVVGMSYDQEGRQQGVTRGAVTSSYGYDAAGRLHTLGDDLAGTTRDVTTTLGYNPAAQITSENRDNDAYAYTGLANKNQGYSVNGLNQYTAIGGSTPTYDDNGNLTSDDTKSYGYDAENRMVTAPGASLTYDPLGRLWQVTGNGATTQFLYDGDQLTAEYGNAGNLLRRYVHGTSEDDPQLWYDGSGLGDRRSLQSDHEGSIDSVADAGGNALAVNSYDEYGKPATSNQGRFQYTGQAWLPEAGLYYYKARMYDPMTGRFMQTDPIGYKDQVNLYAYVANDPVNQTDQSGECPWCVGAVIGLGLDVAVQVATTGHVDVSAKGLAELAISAASGAAGVGIAGRAAQLTARFAITGARAVATKAAISAAGGAALGATARAANNAVNGRSLGNGVGRATALGAALGGAGEGIAARAAGDAEAAQGVANRTGAMVGTSGEIVARSNGTFVGLQSQVVSPQSLGAQAATALGRSAGNVAGNAPNDPCSYKSCSR